MPFVRSYYDIINDMVMEDAWRRMHRAPSIRTTPLTVFRVAQEVELGKGTNRCTVGLRTPEHLVRTVTVPCDTIGTYRIGDTYEERIEKVG
jgi:hypothetical protein